MSGKNDKRALDLLAREAIQSGVLPRDRPEGVWGGPGSGEDCSVCGRPVKTDELGYEIEIDGSSGPDSLQLHIQCFTAWDLQCQEFDAPDHGRLRWVENRASMRVNGRDITKRQG